MKARSYSPKSRCRFIELDAQYSMEDFEAALRRVPGVLRVEHAADKPAGGHYSPYFLNVYTEKTGNRFLHMELTTHGHIQHTTNCTAMCRDPPAGLDDEAWIVMSTAVAGWELEMPAPGGTGGSTGVESVVAPRVESLAPPDLGSRASPTMSPVTPVSHQRTPVTPESPPRMSPVTPASPERIPVAPESVPVPMDDSPTPTVPMDECSSPGTSVAPSEVEDAVPDAPELLRRRCSPFCLQQRSRACIQRSRPEWGSRQSLAPRTLARPALCCTCVVSGNSFVQRVHVHVLIQIVWFVVQHVFQVLVIAWMCA